MKKGFGLFLLLASLCVNHVFAGGLWPLLDCPEWNWVATFSAGPAWESAGKTQTFYLAEGIEKTYISDNSNDTLFDGDVYIGAQKKLSQRIYLQSGIAVGFTSSATLSGDIWDDADPQFNNYTYSYKIQHTHIMLKEKLLLETCYGLMPWISAGLGVGFNRSHAFTNTPILEEALPTPNFASHTETTFSYTFGAGVQKIVNQHWQIGLGYEFLGWGKSHLGRAYEQTLNSGLSLDHLYSNGVLFNITYIR